MDRRSSWWGAGTAVAVVGWGAQQFAPLLLMYRAELGVTATTVQAVFGAYVVGLIPGLLFGGPISDRHGRRRVTFAALVASLAASLMLIAGGTGVGWLFAGRLVAGFASGAGFSCGAAWIKELSGPGQGARRATIAMTAGFGLGPLVAGVLAQWAPAPTVLPYVPHLVLALAAFPLVARSRETGAAAAPRRTSLPELRTRRFRAVIVPLAPWVFGSVSIAVAYLPGLVESRLDGHALIFSTLVTLLCAGAGIAAVPLARRIDDARLLGAALAVVTGGVLVAALAAATTSPALVVVAAVVLGGGYGGCQVCGLREVQHIAAPDHLGGLTAAYQAVSYLGFAASLPLAAAASVVPPSVLLLVVAVLAAITLAWTTIAARIPVSVG